MADTISGPTTSPGGDISNGSIDANSSSSSSAAPPLPQSFEFPSNLPTPPFINISGIPNFRDIGGYLTAASYLSSMRPGASPNNGPQMVRRNLIYRCAHPQLLTTEGNTQLTEKFKIKHIFDLRSAPEVKKLSASLPATASTDAVNDPHSSALSPNGITRHFVPVYEDADYSGERLAQKSEWYTMAQSKMSNLPFPYSEGFVNAYRDIALYGTISSNSCPSHNAAAYPTILRQILDKPDEPIIFHCTAGKDRTGVLAALLLRLAGVDDETIGWEYALTEPGLGSWRDLFIERIAKTGMGGAGVATNDKSKEKDHQKQQANGHEKADSSESSSVPNTSSYQITALRPHTTRAEAATIVSSRAGNMRAFLKLVVDDEFGGVEKYFTGKCGLKKEEVERLREILLVPVEKIEDVVPVQAIKIQGWTAEGGVKD